MKLIASDITYSYDGKVTVLDKISVTVTSGQILGIYAPSGYGKSTLAKIMAGYLKPNSGKVYLNGYTSNDKFNPVQLIHQHPELAVNPRWTMERILNEAYSPGHQLKTIMGIDDNWLSRYPNELSGGELQRFCVLRSLCDKTKFIIADEMTTMLDGITSAQIWHSVCDIVRERDLGLLVISHDMKLLDIVCDDVLDLTKQSNL